MSGVIYVAVKSAIFDFEGKRVLVKKGKTTVREGHALLVGHEQLFKPFVVDYEVTEVPPAPVPVAASPHVGAEEATSDPDRPRRRGRPPLPRDEYGNIIHSNPVPEPEQEDRDSESGTED